MSIEELFQCIQYRIGEEVEFNNKIGRDFGVVTGIYFRENGVRYAVVWSNKVEETHYGFELKKAEIKPMKK